MTVADDLEAARAALVMINPAPYNAEAPPAGSGRGHHPHRAALRAQQLRRARRTTAPWRSAAPSSNPTTLTLDDLRALPAHEHAVTLECAGNGRLDMRPLPTGEPWGDYAVSTARWTGALLHDVLAQVEPVGGRRRRPVRGRRPRRRTTSRRSCRRPTRTTSPSTASLPLAQAADPASGILIAYEMNGQPLGPDHGAPFRLIVPHWYAVASVKWLKRIDVLTEPYTGEFQTGHYMYQWPDRPHEPVTLMRVRARITDPAPGLDHRRRALHRPREGLVRAPARSPASTSASPAKATGSPAQLEPPTRSLPLAGLDLHLGHAPTSAGTPCAPGPPTPPATCNPTCRRGTGWATATTPSRSSTSTSADRCPGHASRPTPGVGRPQQPWSSVPSRRASFPIRRACATSG